MARTNTSATPSAKRDCEKPAAIPAKVPTREIKDYLEQQMAYLAQVLPRHLTPERMIQIVSLLVYKTPKLRECPPASILAGAVQAASLGLDLAPSMMEAFLIPRWNKDLVRMEAQFQPGYQGLRKLAMQSGEVSFIRTDLVREGDHFECWWQPDLHFVHRPLFDDSRSITLAYSYAKLRSGDRSVEVMTIDQLEKVRLRSQKPDSGPWQTDRPEMYRKSVLKRHTKSLPRSLELAEAIEADNREYDLGDVAPRAAALGHFPTRSAALAHQLAGPAPAPTPEPEFDASEGVARPVYSEDDMAQIGIEDPDETPRGGAS